jgi:DNA (cytosine-5)-methyltransferase 1
MNHLGLFSGIGGFEEAFRRAGASLIGLCEIEPNAQRVLRRHFPGVRIINDVKAITKETFGGISIELITGGFPCQDLSVAGRRAGLDGERSGLWFEYLRIIDMFRPRWVEIENVPGLLSSNGGEDFAIILRGLVELGYGVAWRVFDSQFDGVAQRRERVFIVASLGNSSCAEVLFERESGAWDSAPSREAGASVTALTANGVGTCGADDNQAQGVHLVPIGCRMTAFGEYVDDGTSSTLKRRDFKDATDLVVQPQISHALTSEGADASEDGMGRGTPIIAFQQGVTIHGTDKTARVASYTDIAGSLRTKPPGSQENSSTTAVLAFTQNTRNEVRYINGDGQITGALAAEAGTKQQSYISGQYGVRRLTPRECERLQGFPDDWTRYGDDGREISDSARYRMLGNAVCLPTVEWIAQRILNKSFPS